MSNRALLALEHGAGLDIGKLTEIARALYLLGLTDDPSRWEPDLEGGPGEGFAGRSTTGPDRPPHVLGPFNR